MSDVVDNVVDLAMGINVITITVDPVGTGTATIHTRYGSGVTHRLTPACQCWV